MNFAAPVTFILTGIALAGVGSLMFLLTKKAFQWTVAVSIVAGFVAAVVGTADLGYRAWYQTSIGAETARESQDSYQYTFRP